LKEGGNGLKEHERSNELQAKQPISKHEGIGYWFETEEKLMSRNKDGTDFH
jgi:hypothetical protein